MCLRYDLYYSVRARCLCRNYHCVNANTKAFITIQNKYKQAEWWTLNENITSCCFTGVILDVHCLHGVWWPGGITVVTWLSLHFRYFYLCHFETTDDSYDLEMLITGPSRRPYYPRIRDNKVKVYRVTKFSQRCRCRCCCSWFCVGELYSLRQSMESGQCDALAALPSRNEPAVSVR